jgi:type II secretion system protein D
MITTKAFKIASACAFVWLCCSAKVQAQAFGRPAGTGTGTGTGTPFRGNTGSPLGGSSTSSGGATTAREYNNATMMGDALFSVDPETRKLIVITDEMTWTNVAQVVSNLDRPKPQVLIKVVFLEVQHDNALDVGIEGQYTHNPFPSTIASNSIGQNFGLAGLGNTGQTIGQTVMPTGEGLYQVLGSDFQATVRAIASAEKAEVLSRPSILVRNNQPATITVGESIPLVTATQFNTLGGQVNTVGYQNVGIILQVTPFITQGGLVEMILTPQISSIAAGGGQQIASNVFSPVIELRSADTVVVAPDGQTVVIGGLMENDKTIIDSKIPLLGDIPLLGSLFTHKQRATTKKELIIFLTPHIVQTPDMLASRSAAETSKAELAPKAFSEQEWNKFFDSLPFKSPPKKSGKHVKDSD